MLPKRVQDQLDRATAIGFTMACEAEVGQLLAVLAAAVLPNGRVLELGTGAGVGTAWLVEGLVGREDVEVVTIELEASVADVAREGDWPSWVDFRVGDALELLPTVGQFDLVFADAPAGKWFGLDLTIAALRLGGLLVVDDMAPAEWAGDDHRDNTTRVAAEILASRQLLAVELGWSSGVIIAARRADG